MKDQLKILIIENETLMLIGLRQVIKFFWLEPVFLSEEIIAKDDGGTEEVPDIIMLMENFSSRLAGLNKLKKLREAPIF